MTETKHERLVYEDSLAPVYLEMEAIAFANPVFDNGRSAIKIPSTEAESKVLGEMTEYLWAIFARMSYEEKIAYLGLSLIEPGEYFRGTEHPTPDKRAGARYQFTPRRPDKVEYGFHISKTVIPNILYELAVSDLDGFQIRTLQSPSHLHPAVNLMQGNAVTMLEWLSKVSNLRLRLPTEKEWELTANVISNGKEFLHQQPKGEGSAHLFDPDDYATHLIHDIEYSKGANGVLMGGNVWEMTTPSLEADFERLPPGNSGAVWGGTIYRAKGGGFQHCSYTPRLATEMACDVTLRSPSLGFRMVAEERNRKQWKGWRERTGSVRGEILHNGERFKVHNSSLHFVQTGDTEGLIFVVNGEKINANIDNAVRIDRPYRSTELHSSSGLYVGQVEHVMTALAGLNIWNVMVVVDGAQAAPVGDFSFLPFVTLLQRENFYAGSSRILEVRDRIVIKSKGSRCVIEPGEAEINVRLDFASINGAIGVQTARFKPGVDDFIKEIAPARTFIRSSVDQDSWNDVRTLSLRDLPEFGSIEKSPLPVAVNTRWVTEMRFDNEPARHKLGDFIGDMALLNMPIVGQIYVDKPGHEFNLLVAKRLAKLVSRKDDRLEVVGI